MAIVAITSTSTITFLIIVEMSFIHSRIESLKKTTKEQEQQTKSGSSEIEKRKKFSNESFLVAEQPKHNNNTEK